MTPEEILAQYYGYTEFRPGQREVIDQILSGKDVIAIMPTGAGKSVCYQIPALLLPGITIVISPLISLMKDQVEALVQGGIPAAYLNSTVSQEEYFSVLEGLRSGQVKILYVAPERLMTEGFLRLAQSMEISMVSVDEAHCVSQWGQDFRQSYLDIPEFVEQLPHRPVCSAFTATATEKVEEDIVKILRLQDPMHLKTGFDRKNLFFDVRRPNKKETELLHILQKEMQGKSGIVYCSTRKNVEEVCMKLCLNGINATRYHAGLSEIERSQNQEDFLYDRKPVMVATNAFGMGIDKSNVSFVVHYNMPMDLESYYQEAGRAGRDGAPATCILLYSGQDVRLQNFLLEKSRDDAEMESEELREALYQSGKERLKQMTYYATSTYCLRKSMLRYFGEHCGDSCGNCSVCKGNFEEKDATLEAKKIISCIYRAGQKNYHISRTLTAQVLSGSKNEKLERLGLNQLSTYGIMQEYSIREITDMIDQMLQENLLVLQDQLGFPELLLTQGSIEVIRNQQKFTRRILIQKPIHTNAAASENGAETLDEELFQKLREKRKELAMKEGVPAYIIFTDAALRDMCRLKPKTMGEFRQCKGVGVLKAQKYGKYFLDLLL